MSYMYIQTVTYTIFATFESIKYDTTDIVGYICKMKHNVFAKIILCDKCLFLILSHNYLLVLTTHIEITRLQLPCGNLALRLGESCAHRLFLPGHMVVARLFCGTYLWQSHGNFVSGQQAVFLP